jgi:hypothetical protein
VPILARKNRRDRPSSCSTSRVCGSEVEVVAARFGVSGATVARLQGKSNNNLPEFSPVAQRRTVLANYLVL